jgi:PAS domain S-box-containing protein
LGSHASTAVKMAGKKRIKFTQLIQMWQIVFLIVLGGSIIAIDTIRSYRDFNSRADQMRTEYTQRQKKIIKQQVEHAVDMIHHEKARAERLTKSKIISRVYEAYAVAQNIYQENKATKSKAEIQKMILDAIRPIRYEQGSGYYLISRLDGVAVLFPSKPELEGKNLIDVKDARGQHLTKDIIQIVKQSGEGFYQYQWTKPNTAGDHFKKISFFKNLGLYDWFIGTGLYVDDLENQIKSDLLSSISRIRFGKEGYIFINRLNGDALVANGKVVSGTKKLWEVFNKNPEKTKDLFKKEYDAALKPNGDYIYYSIIKLSDPHTESPKTSFIYGIPELQWLVGAGVYLDDVETEIALMQNELNRQIKTKMLYSLIIAAGIFVFFLFLSSRLNRRLKKDFNQLISFFNRASLSNESIDRDKLQFDELDRMAENANKMLTDRRQAEEALNVSEEKYSAIFHEAHDGIVLIEAETGSISDCNPQFAKMTGRSLSDLRQMKIWDIRPVDKMERAKEKFFEVKGENYDESVKVEILKPDGTIVPIEFVSKWVDFQNKTLILSIVRDITERLRTEEAMQKMEKLESVGTLAGGIAHDFNNILMGVYGNISIAREDLPKDHPSLKSLEDAENSMNRAIRLTKQLLTFAKGGEPVTERIRLDRLVEEVVRFDLSGSNVKPVIRPAGDLWLAEVDKGQIQQVFSNLSTNARQAMPDGGHLYVSLENADIAEDTLPGLNRGKYIRISVTDEGTGIDLNHFDRIFDPYFTTKQSGSGLGLATAYSIINKHGGSIAVESQLGKGSTFTLYLPASKSQQLPEVKHSEVKGSDIEQAARILVMDDEEIILKLVTGMLEKSGYSVETASGGQQAIDKYKQALEDGNSFDVVIMDLTIPGGMGGKEAIKDILKIDPQARVIVSSGYANDQVMANYAEYGFQGIVAKPYTRSELLKVLSRVLGKMLNVS